MGKEMTERKAQKKQRKRAQKKAEKLFQKYQKTVSVKPIPLDKRFDKGIRAIWEYEVWPGEEDFKMRFIHNVWREKFWDITIRCGDVMIWAELFKDNLSNEEMVSIVSQIKIFFKENLLRFDYNVQTAGYPFSDVSKEEKANFSTFLLGLHHLIELDPDESDGEKKECDVNLFFGYRSEGLWIVLDKVSQSEQPILEEPGETTDGYLYYRHG